MSAKSSERYMGIDFFRGFFILTMCMDHFSHLVERAAGPGPVPFRLYSYNTIGWSNGAEFFVFFSGYVIATVYARTLQARGFWATQVRATHRSWELYARSVLIWGLCVAAVHGLFEANTAIMHATQLERTTAYADGGITAFMTLRYFPTFFEILPVYMVLMLFSPGFLLLQAKWRHSAVIASGMLWLLVQFQPQINLHTDAGAWRMNPFAWQFLFFLGMWFAKEMPLHKFDQTHRSRKVLVAVGLLALCTFVKVLDKADVALPLIGVIDIPYGKTTVEPVRLAHFLLMLYLLAMIMPSNEWVRSNWLTHNVARVGTHSLDCFALSILLGYVTAGLYSTTDGGIGEYLALVAVNTLGVVLAAYWFTWLKSPPWKPPSDGAPKVPSRDDAPSAGAWLATPRPATHQGTSSA